MPRGKTTAADVISSLISDRRRAAVQGLYEGGPEALDPSIFTGLLHWGYRPTLDKTTNKMIWLHD